MASLYEGEILPGQKTLDGMPLDTAVAEAALHALLLSYGGGGSFLFGSLPPFGAPSWSVKAGQATVTAASHGFLNVPYEEAFLNGVLSVAAWSDALILARTTSVSLAQFQVRRLDGRNIDTTVYYVAVGC